jgi:hypothetical protein
VTVEPVALARAWFRARIPAMLGRSESFVSSPSRQDWRDLPARQPYGRVHLNLLELFQQMGALRPLSAVLEV